MKKQFVIAILAAFSLTMAGNAQNLKGFAYGDVEKPRGYNYEKGICTTITFKWNDRAGTLTIAKRQGSYPGMLATRTFNVKVVDRAEKKVNYTGREVKIKL